MAVGIKKYDNDFYKNLINTRNISYSENTRALEIVKNFIITKNLILTGGMAIDLALRLKGDKIYSDDQLPDYDFYSTDHSADAYELSSILCKKEFTDVSCIVALHITTMRVRVDFETVADITYCPKRIFSHIPTLVYDGMRIVHPHWQMLDQHSSLALPFENPSREVIFNRWKKDMERYDVLYKYYPIIPVEVQRGMPSDTGITLEIKNNVKYINQHIGGAYVRSSTRELLAKTLEIPSNIVKIPLKQLSGSCINGWGAVNYKMDGDNILLSIPDGEHISVASFDYIQFIKTHGLEITDYFSEYFGKTPRRVVCKTDILDTYGRKKHIEIYDIKGILIGAKQICEKNDVWVCNVQWVMLYLLVRIFSSDDPKIVFTAEERYVYCRDLVMQGENPSIVVYGTLNFTSTYIAHLKKSKETLYNIKSVKLLPSNAYPKLPLCDVSEKFDQESSEYFMIDGRRLDSFNEYILNPYPEYSTQSVCEKKVVI